LIKEIPKTNLMPDKPASVADLEAAKGISKLVQG